MSEQKTTTSLDNLKKVLNLPMVFCIALKQIIGGGVIALTGVAIGMTGAGVPLAFLLAACTSILAGIPFAILSSSMPVTGGMYTWPTRLINRVTGFMTLWCFFLTNVSLSLYALTAAGYIRVFYPGLPEIPLAFGILTVFYFINLSGAKATASIGMILTLIMASAILLFIFTGLPQVNPEQLKDMFPKGIMALCSATGILLFTTGGAAMIAELGGEMKNPGRDIPIAIIGATSVAAIVYILAAVVAVGVLPIPEVANQPLTLVAKRIMGHYSFLYFSIGAGIISVLGIINSQMLWGSKSLLVACDDNWLPRWLAGVNKRFGTPHYLLTGLYFVGLLPIVSGLSVKEIAIAANIVTIGSQTVVVGCCLVMYLKHRDIYNRGLFKINAGWLLSAIIIVSISLNTFLIVNMALMDAGAMTAAIIIGWVIIGFVIVAMRKNMVRENSMATAAAAEAAAAARGK